MLFNNLIFALLLGGSFAVNLRNGPKTLDVNLNGLVGSTSPASDSTLEARRKLAMHGMAIRDLADFNWDLNAEDGYPTIDFEGAADDKEVLFKYNYTGTTTAAKKLEVKLFRGDCETPASTDAVGITSNVDDGAGEYSVEVDIKQDSITGTPEYMDIDVSNAMINFCVRVDYLYEDESINFHETNVTINVDLAANFTLTAVSVERIDADQVDEDVALNCEVQAYFCDAANEEEDPQPTFVQGSIMQVCVEIADVDRALYHLGDVMDMGLKQKKSTGPDDESTIVEDQYAVGLSDKQCRNGICNIRHQLSSKFFDERNPNNLDISGVAICAFGPLSDFTRRVNRGYTSAFTNNGDHVGLPLLEDKTIEECKAACLANNNCQSFSATAFGEKFNCKIYEAPYILDEDLEPDTTSVIYARNNNVE